MDSGRSVPGWDAIARHLAGEGEPAERAALEAFLRNHPEDAELLRALDSLSRRVPPSVPEGLDVGAALASTKARRDSADVVSLADRGVGRRRPVLLWVGVAAAAAAALVLSRDSGITSDAAPPAPDVVYRGTPGRVDSVRLADGSVAVLAPGAELTVPAGYPEADRTVRLVGQGWFRAAHDGAHPFTVLAGEAVVRDIGTAFSIRPGINGEIRVAVHEGSVMVRGGSESAEVQLNQGDETRVVSARVQAPSRGTVGLGDADWVSGQLHFRDVTMEEFGRTVAEWTGWVVRLDDPGLRVLRVTQDLSLSEARQRLEETALILGARVSWVGDTAVVSRNGGR